MHLILASSIILATLLTTAFSIPIEGGDPLLTRFYLSENYEGFAWDGFGTSNTCYDLPFLFSGNVQSMQINTAVTEACQVFTDVGCSGQVGNVNRNGVQVFEGYFDEGVKSWWCDF